MFPAGDVPKKGFTMIEIFPLLTEHQVALSRADINTGHVLDENLLLAMSPLQKVYTIFDDVNDAKDAAKALVKANNQIECYIYGVNKCLVAFIDYMQL